ncbi:MAG: TIGR02147 family protein [Bdellovibrionota bacterium]
MYTNSIFMGMAKAVFEFKDYKRFVLDSIAGAPNGGRGLRRQLAEAIGCQTAYVSHVLAGDRHFSLEQAEALARFFELRQDETDFLLLLVEQNRAGTPSLQKVLLRQLDARREEYQELLSRVESKGRISEADKATYYSTWHYQAVRVALSLPHCRTVGAIAKELKLSVDRVNEVMSFFLQRGLAREEGGKYFPTAVRIHLPSDSPDITKLHSNWRVHALRSLDSFKPEDFHYSGVVSLSRTDYETVREILRKAVVDALEVVKPSKEERLAVMNLDFYGF